MVPLAQSNKYLRRALDSIIEEDARASSIFEGASSRVLQIAAPDHDNKRARIASSKKCAKQS